MRALLCDCGQHLKADDKEALYRQVREHLEREDRPREHPLGRFLEEEQVKQLVANRSYNLEDSLEVVHPEGSDRSEEEDLKPLFYFGESMRAAVLGTREG